MMLAEKLDKPVAIYPLVTFRILFGFVMLIGTIRFVALGWIEDHYLQPLLHFTYYGFSWIKVAPAWLMYTIHGMMILSAAGIMLGYCYRLSAIIFFATFTYTELIDVTYYLNHYYFVSWVAFILIFLPAHQYFSIDAWRKPSLQQNTTPWWTIAILQFMIALVYVFAGIAKINHDWLMQAMPLRIWLPAHHHLPVVGDLLRQDWVAYAFSWMGMLFDCTVFFFLMYKPTRLFAWLILVGFHLITGFLFQIGVFPVVMITSTLIFFSSQWHQHALEKLQALFGYKPLPKTEKSNHQTHFFLRYGLYAVVSFHLLFPFRYLLYPSNVFWTEEGYRFSWRVMLMEKAGTATFYVKDQLTNKEGVVDNAEFLNSHQEKQMAMQPDMILQYAHFLKNEFSKRGLHNPSVRAEVYVTLNGVPSRLLIDPTINLALLQDSWQTKQWVRPFNH